ncbi:PilZ domain-containing protein [Microvirga massiliensis]|uniref:PilZ domain-containing protein n=1 Tax=Microvirga massiliensis TaxID=1033741 RepID=UPI000661617C|nr:PilZ domain-containing protein [Microvirga massiliensis]
MAAMSRDCCSTAELMGREPPAPETNPAQVLERHSLPRRRALLRGRIESNYRYSTMDCVVRDITEQGARLVITGDDALPSVFELALPLKNRNHRAEIVWRKGQECGVRSVA